MNPKCALVPLAPGFEEIEALTVIDILRRADVEVVAAGLGPGAVRGSHGIVVTPDALLESVMDRAFDAVILPGGREGTERLAADPRIRELVRRHYGQGRLVAAICAAPAVLHEAGLLDGVRATSHPSAESRLANARYTKDRVVVDGRIVTSRSAGTAMAFAFTLLSLLAGEAKAAEINAGVLAEL